MNSKKRNRIDCIILGGGGHAAVLIDCITQAGMASELNFGVLDSDPSKWGSGMAGFPVLGGDDLLKEIVGKGARYFLVGLGGVRSNEPRKLLFETAISAGLKPLSVRHPSAIVSPQARLGEGDQLLPGCIVNAGAVLGRNVIVNSGAIVEHDCRIGDHVHVATGARLASTIIVGELAFIGAGAVVRQCITIGERAMVGAGAVVVKDVPAGAVVMGVPAR